MLSASYYYSKSGTDGGKGSSRSMSFNATGRVVALPVVADFASYERKESTESMDGVAKKRWELKSRDCPCDNQEHVPLLVQYLL